MRGAARGVTGASRTPPRIAPVLDVRHTTDGTPGHPGGRSIRAGQYRHRSEAESFSGVSERRATTCPIKAQSTAIARAMARICNAEWVRFGVVSGHERKTLSLSAHRTSAQVQPTGQRKPGEIGVEAHQPASPGCGGTGSA